MTMSDIDYQDRMDRVSDSEPDHQERRACTDHGFIIEGSVCTIVGEVVNYDVLPDDITLNREAYEELVELFRDLVGKSQVAACARTGEAVHPITFRRFPMADFLRARAAAVYAWEKATAEPCYAGAKAWLGANLTTTPFAEIEGGDDAHEWMLDCEEHAGYRDLLEWLAWACDLNERLTTPGEYEVV